MCACDSDLKLVALLRDCHLMYSHCEKIEGMEFALLILLRGQRCQTDEAKLWNQHVKIMVHYGTCLQDACVARNSN